MKSFNDRRSGETFEVRNGQFRRAINSKNTIDLHCPNACQPDNSQAPDDGERWLRGHLLVVWRARAGTNSARRDPILDRPAL